jgi:hypothetical protein
MNFATFIDISLLVSLLLLLNDPAHLLWVETQIGTLLSESADAKNIREYRTGLREIQVTLKAGPDIASQPCGAKGPGCIPSLRFTSTTIANAYPRTSLRGSRAHEK